MSLYIYKSSGGSGPVSQESTFESPITFSYGQEGGVVEQRFFLRMGDPTGTALSDGVMYAQDTANAADAEWVQFAPDVGGAAGLYAPTMEFELSLNEELPFWIKVTVPQAQVKTTKTSIGILTEYVLLEPLLEP